MAVSYEELLKKGSIVEVSSEDEGLRGSWFTATVVRGWSRRNKKIFVEYRHLMADEACTKPLREYVDWILVRPVPPREPPGSVRYNLSDEVDAFHNDGWWEGVVTEVLEGSRYSVFFRCSREQIQFGDDDLRLHREWVHGEWVPPFVEVPQHQFPPPQSSGQSPKNGKQRERRSSSIGDSSKAATPNSKTRR